MAPRNKAKVPKAPAPPPPQVTRSTRAHNAKATATEQVDDDAKDDNANDDANNNNAYNDNAPNVANNDDNDADNDANNDNDADDDNDAGANTKDDADDDANDDDADANDDDADANNDDADADYANDDADNDDNIGGDSDSDMDTKPRATSKPKVTINKYVDEDEDEKKQPRASEDDNALWVQKTVCGDSARDNLVLEDKDNFCATAGTESDEDSINSNKKSGVGRKCLSGLPPTAPKGSAAAKARKKLYDKQRAQKLRAWSCGDDWHGIKIQGAGVNVWCTMDWGEAQAQGC